MHPTNEDESENGPIVLQKGSHSFSFGFEFPLLTSRCGVGHGSGHPQLNLPPSLELVNGRLKANAKYRVRIQIRRARWMKRNLNAQHELIFKPLSPPQHELVETLDPVISTGMMMGVQCHAFVLPPKCLPPYMPSIMLLMERSSSTKLRIGEPLEVKLRILSPPELVVELGALWMAGLTLRLKAVTYVRFNRTERQMVSYTNICSFTGYRAVEFEPGSDSFEIPSYYWDKNIIPTVLPSFSTCVLRNEHTVEAIIDLHVRPWSRHRVS